MFEVADIVQRKGQPTTFGFVDQLEPFTVIWLTGGREAQKNHRWGVHDPQFSEVCSPDDLEITDCPGCRETQCWCGVGR
jgi:hypothetical protein